MEDNKEKETGKTPTEPTPEEQLEALKQTKADLETQLEEKTKGLKTAHDTLRRKDDELKRRGDLEGKVASLEDQIKFFIAYQSETQGKTGEDFEEAKATRPKDLLKTFQNITAESERKRQMESQRQENLSKIQSIRERVEALGLPEDDDVYWEIEDFATRGKFERAEARLKKLEDAKGKEKEAPKETEKEIEERLTRKILEEKGYLKPEVSSPSASGELSEQQKLDARYPTMKK